MDYLSLTSAKASKPQSQGSSYSLPSSLSVFKLWNLLYFTLLFAYLPSLSECLKIIPEGSKLSRWVNESFVLTCMEDGDMTDRKLEWTRGGVTDPSFIMQPGQSGRQLQLLVYFSKKHNGGEYTCNLKDTRSNLIMDSKSLTMYIFDRIHFIGPQIRTVKENSQAELPCRFSYDENFSVSVSWLRNGIEPLDGTNGKYRISNSEGRPYTSVLSISQVNKTDAGSYTCQVLINSFMKTDIALFKLGLEVVYGPKFLQNFSDTGWIDEKKFTAREGREKSVTLRCAVDAHPNATITWQLATNRALMNDTNYSFNITKGHNWSELKLYYKSSGPTAYRPVKEKTVTPNEFRCDASNGHGEDSRRYFVKISKIPKMPEIIEYNQMSNLLTLLLRDQKINPPIDKYKIRIANKEFEFHANSTNQTYSIHIENVPGGHHAFRLFAHNPVGWSEPLATEAMKLQISFSCSLIPTNYILIILLTISSLTYMLFAA